MILNTLFDCCPTTISVKPNCLTASIEQAHETEVFSYDYAGRPWTAYFDQVSYRRGLDGKMVAKWQTPDGGRARRWLAPGEAAEVEERARRRMTALYAHLQAQGGEVWQSLTPLGQMGFERAIAFDAVRSRQDAAAFLQVYKPVGILPPDQYMAVILQATEGCSFNTCTFCTFYRDRRFRIRPAGEFLDHARQVKAFLGDGLSLRRTIFLGDANALVIPMPRLLPLLETVHQVFDVEGLGGIYAFLDGFSGDKKSVGDFHKLKECGLERVYVGMESGNAALLKFLKKPGAPADALNAVRAMKAAGLAVGVIVLLGVGGRSYAREHVRDTIHTLNAMELEAGDLIYFSELVVSEGMEYARQAYQAGLAPLTESERLAQGERIEDGLVFSAGGGSPHIARYDIREFVY